MCSGKTVIARVVLAAGMLLAGGPIFAPEADAAQAYYCNCDGEKKRFLASSRYCEKQNKVKQCTSTLYRKTYSHACKQRGCRLP